MTEQEKSKPAKLLVFLTLAIAIIVIAVLVLFHSKPKLPPAVSIDTTNQPTIGKKDAPIHIVAFEDLKCFNCKRYSTTIYPAIKKKFVDTGTAKYTMITLSFIPGSTAVANAAQCLYHQDKSYFFPFVKYVYENQPPEDQDWATVSKLIEFAKNSVPKANLDKLSDCIVEGKYNQRLTDNLSIATKIMNSKVATPSIYINGHLVQPLSEKRMTAIINELK